jgi:nicotinamide-nucleotide amidase
LLGQIANTNAQEISEALADIGVDVLHHSVVGDNKERVVAAVGRALDRSDAVIVTGGLGPTPDDLTREAVAEALGVAVRRDESLVAYIKEVFARLGRDMPESNLKQADLPDGAVAIPPEGTAPGFHVQRDDKLVVCLPGVPWEMRAMLVKDVLPLLRERAGEGMIVSRQVLVVGLGESLTHDKIVDLVDAQTNPTIAYLAGKGVVRVRITAKASGEREALAMIEPIESEIRSRLGSAAVRGTGRSLEEAVGSLLTEKAASVAVAESLTGGLLGAAITSVPGASRYFKGSLVLYSTDSKSAIAGVDQEILMAGTVTQDVAIALARAAAERFRANLGLATTGVAGPAEHGGEAVGAIWVAAFFAGQGYARKVRGDGDRESVRAIAVTAALDLGRRLLEGTL